MVREASRIEFRPFWQQDEELVSPHSRDVAAQRLGQCPSRVGQLSEGVVTGCMIPAVVELLEMMAEHQIRRDAAGIVPKLGPSEFDPNEETLIVKFDWMWWRRLSLDFCSKNVVQKFPFC